MMKQREWKWFVVFSNKYLNIIQQRRKNLKTVEILEKIYRKRRSGGRTWAGIKTNKLKTGQLERIIEETVLTAITGHTLRVRIRD